MPRLRLLLLGVALCASRAEAQSEQAFSATQVNPAQLSVRGRRIDVTTQFFSERRDVTAANDHASMTAKGPLLGVAGAIGDQDGVWTSQLKLTHRQSVGEFASTNVFSSNQSFGEDVTEVTPSACVALSSRSHFGLAYEVTTRRYTGVAYGPNPTTLTYTKLVPGIALAAGENEVGIAYSPNASANAAYSTERDTTAEVTHLEPSRVIAHGRARVGSAIAYGNIAYATIPEGADSSTSRFAELLAGGAKDFGDTEFHGSVAYQARPFGATPLTPETVPAFGAALGYDRRYNDTTRFGSEILFTKGRGSQSTEAGIYRIERDTFALRITGDVRL